MREEENIEALSRAILNDARTEAEQIQVEAKTKADAVRQQAKEQAESERKAILEHAKVEAERLRGQVIASAQLKARTIQLEYREKLLDKVFDAARQRLSSIQKRSDYDQIVTQLLREALIQLKADRAEVRADDATMKSLDLQTLEQISKELNAHISMGKSLENGLGVVVDTSDGRLHYDNTLETRLTRLQNALRSSVYHVLMGEKL
ncbi:MAG TPA: V-type ATP synthase subunit E family protein [Anaerolineales bacterium]